MAALHRQVEKHESGDDLANLLLEDLRLHLRALERNPQRQPPPEIQARRRSFAH